MKAADYIITHLRDIGVKKVFVVYGAANGDLIDAFTRVSGIEYVATMHEQAATFAAETYSKVTGELGCVIATSGPGGTNLLTGIANCHYDSVPCLFITGQINSQYSNKFKGVIRQVGFQENDIVAMAKPVTKWADNVILPFSVERYLLSAIFFATEGRPGPVLLDIPIDVQKADIQVENLDTNRHYLNGVTEPYRWKEPDTCKIRESVCKFLGDYEKAERPILLIGGGLHWGKDCWFDLNYMMAKLDIPAIPTWNAIDVITNKHPYYAGRVGTYGGEGRNFAIQNSDLLLSIGCRFSGRITGGQIHTFARVAKKYIVDIDRANLEPSMQQVRGDVNIWSDAATFCRIMADELSGKSFNRKTWVTQTKQWVKDYQPCRPEFYASKDKVNPYVFMDVLSKELWGNHIVISDCGGNAVVTYQALKTLNGQRVISSHGNSPMGFSFCGAIGAALAAPERPVVCLIGDGGFNMNIQELQTIINYKLPIKTFIMNNHIYGITRQFQDTNFNSRYEASGPKGYNPPDFLPLVKAYGIKTKRISNHKELRRKIRSVLNYEGAIVCDVDMGEFCQYEPRIFGWKTPIEDMYPYLPRDEFRRNMLIEPLEGWEQPEMPPKKVEDA